MRLADDDTTRATVMRLSRPHPSGGRVIERAAILAAGPEAAGLLAWVGTHGEPEALASAAVGDGLHGARDAARAAGATRNPLRYVLSEDALAKLGD